MTLRLRKLLITSTAGCALLLPATAFGITISENSFAGSLSNTLFLNVPGLSVTNSSLSAAPGQTGIYNNSSGTYGLPLDGIVLSSGDVLDYQDGPNNQSGNTGGPGIGATVAQDATLGGITGQNEHFDVVELGIDFDAGPSVDSVTFFATFGSEEFPEYVGSSFIDGFGLFVNGTNVASVEASDSSGPAPVNVNHPDFVAFPGTELDGVIAPNDNPVLQFDAPINAGQENNFSIILGDASDTLLDTTIYISSFIPTDVPDIPPVNGGGGPIFIPGQTEFTPILPDAPFDGVGFMIDIPFDNPETEEIEGFVDGDLIWIDPPVTTGYTYTITGSAAQFVEVTAPSLATVADPDGYEITANGMTYGLAAGATADLISLFGTALSSFEISGIDPALMLDPANTAAFPLGIVLQGLSSTTSINVEPIFTGDPGPTVPPIPLPAGAPLLVGGLATLGYLARRKRLRNRA